jgi:hypothetical protein
MKADREVAISYTISRGAAGVGDRTGRLPPRLRRPSPRYGAHVAAQRILRDLADLELFPEEQQRSSSYEPQGKKWSCGA